MVTDGERLKISKEVFLNYVKVPSQCPSRDLTEATTNLICYSKKDGRDTPQCKAA